MSGILNSSIGRKFAHFAINILSVFSPDAFNEASHFMGTFWAVQYLLQPILIIGVLFHFVMGFVLEIQNNKARKVSYAKNNGNANSTWMSRNMIWSGGFILVFIVIHMIDFWVHEMNVKYIAGDMTGLIDRLDPASGYRYYEELVVKFKPIWRVALYCIGFVFLALHLLHGFGSAFQSVGANNKYTKALKGVSKVYAIGIPVGFIFIALFHHLTGTH